MTPFPVKLFTPSTARETLDRLRPQAETMWGLFRSMERRRPTGIAPDQLVDGAYFRLVSRYHRVLAVLRSAGVVVRDPRSGRLEFPARREGKLVFLCWKVGEVGLRYWRETGAGDAGRRPLDDDGRWDESER